MSRLLCAELQDAPPLNSLWDWFQPILKLMSRRTERRRSARSVGLGGGGLPGLLMGPGGSVASLPYKSALGAPRARWPGSGNRGSRPLCEEGHCSVRAGQLT